MMMTLSAEMVIRRRMGRKKRWTDVMGAKFPPGTFRRIAAALRKDKDKKEDRTDFVREAVERELERREKAAKPRGRK
jgi:hypothetical protein